MRLPWAYATEEMCDAVNTDLSPRRDSTRPNPSSRNGARAGLTGTPVLTSFPDWCQIRPKPH